MHREKRKEWEKDKRKVSKVRPGENTKSRKKFIYYEKANAY